MPAKPASTAAPAEGAGKETTSARRSTRIAEKPASTKPPSSAPAPKKKRSTAEKEPAENKEEPPSKKPKSDAASGKQTKKPASKAKPSSKAAAKPASTKAVKAKPSSTKKAAAAAEGDASPAKTEGEKAPADEPMPAIAEEEKPADDKAGEKEDTSTTVADTEMKDATQEPAPTATKDSDATGAAAPADDAAKTAKDEAEDIKELKDGDVLPSWTFKNQKNEDIDVGKLAGEKGLVLFLVPKANTPGCTTQACGFRDNYDEFQKAGYAVYCLSADTTTAQTKWQEKNNLPYDLISDPKRKLIAALGAKSANSTKRSHFIFEKGTGKLVDKKPTVKPADSPKLALEFITTHHAA